MTKPKYQITEGLVFSVELWLLITGHTKTAVYGGATPD